MKSYCCLCTARTLNPRHSGLVSQQFTTFLWSLWGDMQVSGHTRTSYLALENPGGNSQLGVHLSQLPWGMVGGPPQFWFRVCSLGSHGSFCMEVCKDSKVNQSETIYLKLKFTRKTYFYTCVIATGHRGHVPHNVKQRYSFLCCAMCWLLLSIKGSSTAPVPGL